MFFIHKNQFPTPYIFSFKQIVLYTQREKKFPIFKKVGYSQLPNKRLISKRMGNYFRLSWQLVYLVIFFVLSNCIYFQNWDLKKIKYPHTPYNLGFEPGQIEVNHPYSQEWCKKYCSEMKKIVDSLPEDYYLEIQGKMDGADTLENRKRISLGRAISIQQLLLKNGISESKVKAIADLEPNHFLGKDLFDPENRAVVFQVKKK